MGSFFILVNGAKWLLAGCWRMESATDKHSAQHR